MTALAAALLYICVALVLALLGALAWWIAALLIVTEAVAFAYRSFRL